MKFIIDTELCDKQAVPIDTTLLLIAMYLDKFVGRGAFDDAVFRKMIIHEGLDTNNNPKNPKITQKGIDYVESIFLNSEFNTTKVRDRFENLAIELRSIFPEGKKAGTAYMWRDSIPKIILRLKAFVKKYGDYKDEDIINATKRYVESFNGDYRYMQLLKYFIFKKDIIGGESEENSQLLSYISNQGEDLDDDWNTSLK
jgi:hypothetical protein